MVKVKRANVVLDVPEVDVQHYIDKGYNVVDDRGHILKEAIPRDIATLQKAFHDKSAKIKALEAEIESLKQQLTEANKQLEEVSEVKKTSKKSK